MHRPIKSLPSSTVCVIGLGYVGLPLARLLSRREYSVIGLDIDKKRLEDIHKSINAPFYDPTVLADMAITDNYEALDHVDIIVVCAPTPVNKDKTPNYRPLLQVFKGIRDHLKTGQLIILESTVSPGTCDEKLLPLLEKGSEFTAGNNFYLAHCPERINPGDNQWDTANIPRVVGANDHKSLTLAANFYNSILDATITPLQSIKEVEAVKIVENCFRDINIAFVNELARQLYT